METVEVVIRIPKIKLDRINKIANGIWGTSNLDAQEMAILNGTILPKGHGELVDRDDLKYAKYNSYAYAIANAPTIIEADKEVENETISEN